MKKALSRTLDTLADNDGDWVEEKLSKEDIH